MSRETDLRARLVFFGKLLYDRRLAHGSAGNLSVRLDDGTILVTPTNSCLGFLHPDAISRVSPAGAHLAGDPPSKEAFFHLAVYEVRPAARAIVHVHSTYLVAVSCQCHAAVDNVLPPLTAYHVMRVGRLPLVPYFRPGDKALAEAVRTAARDHHAMLLANHGPVVAGRSLEEAVYACEELEETAKLSLILAGHRTSPLDAAAIADLAAAFPS